jgi:diadenosine tetraphosphatase ApaH/serine/threonine PP2A family protein phosphatase
MSAFAVISDVHGNLEALQAVLAKIDALGIGTIYSLGDIVGYGPDPEACLLLIEKRCSQRLMGNHEYAVLNRDPGVRYNDAARKALDWTRERIQRAGLLSRISGLKPCFQEGSNYFVHGTVRNPLHEYLRESDGGGYSTFDEIAASLERDFIDFRVCFIGHNHHPFMATTEGFLHPHQGLSEFQVSNEDRFYLSVGSVGQPRDGDPRACFVTFDGAKVTFHRVAYPHEITAGKILAAGLPRSLAERLALGK